MNVILTNTGTLILSILALFLVVFSFVIQNKKIATAMQCASFLCVLATVVYALLLGAELTEILVYILVFVLLSLISFIPKRETKNIEKNVTEDKLDKKAEDEPSEKNENKENGNEL